MKKRLIKATDFYGCDWFFDPKYIIGMTATDYDEWDDNKREFIKKQVITLNTDEVMMWIIG